MANIKSQKKRVRTNEKAHQRNVAVKAAAEAAFAIAGRKLDQAAGKGVIAKNQAANRKSSLALQINAM